MGAEDTSEKSVCGTHTGEGQRERGKGCLHRHLRHTLPHCYPLPVLTLPPLPLTLPPHFLNRLPPHLLARHELQGAVCAKVQHSVRLENLLKEGVVGSKPVVRAGAAREQQAHRVALIAECGLHAYEDVAKLLAINEQLLAVAVEVTGWLAPVLLQGLAVVAQLLLFCESERGQEYKC